jgi:hypothetical protein
MVCAMVFGMFAGCVAAGHEIVPSGHGTFVIPNQDLMGLSAGSAGKAKAFAAATAYCSKLGKDIETVLASESEGGYDGIAPPEIEFRCVAPRAGEKPEPSAH